MTDLIGIATWNYGGGPLASRIERFAGMGYNAVSLSAQDARALCDGSSPEVEEVIMAHSLAVVVHSGFGRSPEPGAAEQVVGDMGSYLSWHAMTGALRTVNYDARTTEGPDGKHPYDADWMRDVLRRLLDLSTGTGVTVGVEDWPRTPEQMQSVEDLLSYSHYGVLIDLGHLNMRIRGSETPGDSFPVDAAQAYLDGFRLPVNELHVHSNNGERDQHAPPTIGSADMRELARMLKRMDVRGPSTIEIMPAWSGLSEEEGWAAARDAVSFWREAFAAGDG